MKKVLLAFDGIHFSQSQFDFVKQMNSRHPVLATGIFLPIVDYSELLYSFGGMAGPVIVKYPEDAEAKTITDNITRFETLCKEHNIMCSVHNESTKHIVEQIKAETRFADLLLLSSNSFYENLGEDIREDYIDNVLHKSECSVVLLPEKFKEPKSVIITYDGSASSVYAIKQFAYIFPEYKDLQVLMIYISNSAKEIPDRNLIEELAAFHFSKLTIFKLKINTRNEFEQWLTENGDTMLVAGAFGRSLFSEMIRKSFISDIIRDNTVPIFVAHK